MAVLARSTHGSPRELGDHECSEIARRVHQNIRIGLLKANPMRTPRIARKILGYLDGSGSKSHGVLQIIIIYTTHRAYHLDLVIAGVE